KKSIEARSVHNGESDTSMTTSAPASAPAKPSPVIVLTPVLGAAAIASWPFCFSFSTTFDPIKPVPPITTIFMAYTLRKDNVRRLWQSSTRHLGPILLLDQPRHYRY